jgi:medium-chain acyl-[acyl-carrier-protein] hydrolase
MHHVQYSDLDQNRHVNNARYVEWIFNQMDLDILENKAPSIFAVEYKQEVRAGDTVLLRKARTQESPLTFAIEGCIAGSEKVCVRSKILF